LFLALLHDLSHFGPLKGHRRTHCEAQRFEKSVGLPVTASDLFRFKDAVIAGRHTASSPTLAVSADKLGRLSQGSERGRKFVDQISNECRTHVRLLLRQTTNAPAV
jgi:hypothetical protein